MPDEPKRLPWPRWVYHPVSPPRLVHSDEEWEALGLAGWTETYVYPRAEAKSAEANAMPLDMADHERPSTLIAYEWSRDVR